MPEIRYVMRSTRRISGSLGGRLPVRTKPTLKHSFALRGRGATMSGAVPSHWPALGTKEETAGAN